MDKKRLLIIVDWFAPGFKAGGPIKSSVNLAFALKSDFEVYVLTTDTDHGELQPYENIPANTWCNDFDKDINVYYAKKNGLTGSQLKREILSVNPDVVYLNHTKNTYFVFYPLWLKLSILIKCKLVVCPRGGLYESALSVKRYKKTPVLTLMKLLRISRRVVFHATNTREKEAIAGIFPDSKIIVADNLPESRQPVFRSVEKKCGELKCIFIARIVAIKNLLFLLKSLENIRARNILLTIVGPAEDMAYWKACQEKIVMLPSNIQVDYKGAIPNEQLSGLVLQHHLFVLPTEGENFGHSIFEAFLNGRPVLISNQTPWLHLNDKRIGWDLPLGQPKTFETALTTAADWTQDDFDVYAKQSWQFAADFLQSSDIKQQYMQLFL